MKISRIFAEDREIAAAGDHIGNGKLQAWYPLDPTRNN